MRHFNVEELSINLSVTEEMKSPVNFCLSNGKFERLGGPLDEIVTVFVHKYNVIMLCPIMTSWRHLIWETGCQDVGCFSFKALNSLCRIIQYPDG